MTPRRDKPRRSRAARQAPAPTHGTPRAAHDPRRGPGFRGGPSARAVAPAPREPSPTGELVCGLRACLAVLARRPGDLQRVAFAPEQSRAIEPLLRHCDMRGIPATALDDGALSRLAGTDQHEGVCAFTAPRRFEPAQALTDKLVRARGVAVAFDRVRNPYNIGAILRSAAYFGLDAALIGMPAPHPALDKLAVRVAEGGAEHLAIARTTDLADTLGRMRARGVFVVGAESDGAHNAFGYEPKRPAVLVLGNEREGISERVRAQCDAVVRIPGSGQVGSLNVSIAASLLIAELMRPTLIGRSG